MRYHVLGVGSIGSLLAFHLKRTLKNASKPHAQQLIGGASAAASAASPAQAAFASPARPSPAPHALPYLPLESSVTLHLRRTRARHGSLKLGSLEDHLAIERDGQVYTERKFRIESNLALNPLLPPPPLYAKQTQRIYVQGEPEAKGVCAEYDFGGQDSIDSLIVTSKADSTLGALRPLAHRLTPASTVVLLQNGQGVLDLLYEKVFTDPAQRPNFILASTTHGAWRKSRFHTVHAGVGELSFGVVPNTSRAPGGFERFLDNSENEAGDSLTSTRPLLDIAGVPELPSTLTLRHTLAALLCMPLNARWMPISELQIGLLRKLVVNACINPLTALGECQNGALVGNVGAAETIRLVCHEASAVFAAQAAARGDALHRDLQPAPLVHEVQRVARLTSLNWSSMHQDIAHGRGSTEVDFMNGYIVNLGAHFGVRTPTNASLARMVDFKSKLQHPETRPATPSRVQGRKVKL